MAAKPALVHPAPFTRALISSLVLSGRATVIPTTSKEALEFLPMASNASCMVTESSSMTSVVALITPISRSMAAEAASVVVVVVGVAALSHPKNQIWLAFSSRRHVKVVLWPSRAFVFALMALDGSSEALESFSRPIRLKYAFGSIHDGIRLFFMGKRQKLILKRVLFFSSATKKRRRAETDTIAAQSGYRHNR